MQLIRMFSAAYVGSVGVVSLLSGLNPVGSVAACFCWSSSLVETLLTMQPLIGRRPEGITTSQNKRLADAGNGSINSVAHSDPEVCSTTAFGNVSLILKQHRLPPLLMETLHEFLSSLCFVLFFRCQEANGGTTSLLTRWWNWNRLAHSFCS